MKNSKTITMENPIFKDTDFNLMLILPESFYNYTFKSQLMYESTRVNFVISKSKKAITNETIINLSLDKEVTKTLPVGKILMDIKYQNGDDCFLICQLQINVKQTITEC